MIYLFDENYNTIDSFDTYSDLVEYINRKEAHRVKMAVNLSLLYEARYPFEGKVWRFSCYKRSHLEIAYSAVENPPMTEIERHAFGSELDLVEICKGDEDKPLQIAVTEEVNLEKLRKDFCLAYSKAHNFLIVETDSYVSNVYG